MKNLTYKLITQFPLLWNTRFPIVFSVLIIINAFYFLLGIGASSSILKFDQSIDYMYFESGLIALSILINTFVFIIWLVFYFRNNAFKANYPISNSKLLLEFLLVFIICLFNISLYVSWNTGVTIGTKFKVTEQEISDAQSVITLASPYIDQNRYKYSNNQYYWSDDFTGNNKGYYLETDTQTIYSAQDKYCCNDTIYSYYYFIDFPYALNMKQRMELSEQNKKWLRTKDTESIRKALESYNDLGRHFHKTKLIDIDKKIKSIFASPEYEFSDFEVYNPDISYDYQDYEPDVETIINNYLEHYYFDYKFWENLLVHIMISLCFALAIISFRISQIRDWVIALISGGIIYTFLGIFAVVSGLDEDGVLVLYFLMSLAFVIFALLGKEFALKKTIYGVVINIGIWSSPFLYMLLRYIIAEVNDQTIQIVPTMAISCVLGIIITSILLILSKRYRAYNEQ